jgi:hypothetical protein
VGDCATVYSVSDIILQELQCRVICRQVGLRYQESSVCEEGVEAEEIVLVIAETRVLCLRHALNPKELMRIYT